MRRARPHPLLTRPKSEGSYWELFWFALAFVLLFTLVVRIEAEAATEPDAVNGHFVERTTQSSSRHVDLRAR